MPAMQEDSTNKSDVNPSLHGLRIDGGQEGCVGGRAQSAVVHVPRTAERRELYGVAARRADPVLQEQLRLLVVCGCILRTRAAGMIVNE